MEPWPVYRRMDISRRTRGGWDFRLDTVGCVRYVGTRHLTSGGGVNMPLILEILGFGLAVVMMAIGMVRYVNGRIEDIRKECKSDNTDLRREIKEDTEDLHTRINEVRKEYVHSDHLDQTLNGLKSQVDHVANSQDQLTQRMDQLLLVLAKDRRKDDT